MSKTHTGSMIQKARFRHYFLVEKYEVPVKKSDLPKNQHGLKSPEITYFEFVFDYFVVAISYFPTKMIRKYGFLDHAVYFWYRTTS